MKIKTIIVFQDNTAKKESFDMKCFTVYLNLYPYLNLCNESTSVCDHVPHNSISFSWQACTWRLTAMAKMVAVHWLVRLNSLMHVAGAGLLSQHGWDTGCSCLSAAFMHTHMRAHTHTHTHTNLDQLSPNTQMFNKHTQTNTCTPRDL